MADNVNETSNIERVDNSDPFENSSKMPAWELAYIRQEYQIYDGPYSDDDDRKWTDSSNWKSNPNYIDDEEEFKKVYSGGTDDTEYKRSTKVSPNVNNNSDTVSDKGPGPSIYKEKSSSEMYNGPDAGFAINANAEWENFYPEVQGRHNALHDLNSYNYIITLVSVSTDQINDPATYKGKIINPNGVENKDFYIVAKSGGYSRENGQTYEAGSYKRDVTQGDSRDKDLFIENLDFETRPGINDMGNSNLTTGSFEIVEPHSVSQFYRELFNSSRFSGHPDYIDAPFLLVISFIGRDAESDRAVTPPFTTRYLPIKIQNSEMEVTEAGARYSVKFLGFNSQATTAVYNTLFDDVTPRVNKVESVESITSSVFLKHSIFEAKRMLQHKQDVDNDADQKAAVEKRLGDQSLQSQVNRGSGGADVEIGYCMPNEYYVWFADGYGGNFPSNGKTLHSLSSGWKSKVKTWTDNSAFEGRPTVGLAGGNRIGGSGLNDSVLPSGALKIKSFEDEKQEREDQKKAAEAVLRTAKSALETELSALDSARQALYNIAKTKLKEDQVKPDKLQDPTASLLEKPDEVKKKVDEQKNYAISIADKLKNLGTGKSSGQNGPPTQAVLTAAEAAEVAVQRDKIIELSPKIAGLNEAVVKAEKELDTLAKEYDKWLQNGGKEGGYNLQSRGEAWSFRKGSNLMTIIDTMITNSVYMDIFKKPELLKQIQSSEMIPWFKTEVISYVIGYDVLRMRYVYEYHYVVSPFEIHYSSMPGINIQFTTEQLKKKAIREYNYIYTGKNLDVLSYNIRYNNLFTTPLLINPPKFKPIKQDGTEQTTNTFLETIENAIQTNVNGQSGFTPTPPVGRLNYREGPNNRNAIGIIFQDFLYNPPFERHLILSDIDIIGDPVYIVGSGITDRPQVSAGDILTKDGEMNTFTREPHVILNIRYPEDIPTASELGDKENSKFEMKLKRDQYSGVFEIFNVRNNFSEGVFKQTLRLARKKNQPEDYYEYGTLEGVTGST